MESESSDSEANSALQDELAKTESIAVFRLRGLVTTVLAAAAIVVSFVVYATTLKAEEREFQSNFDGHSEKIIRSFQDIVTTKIMAAGSLGVTLTAHANGQNATWPFVTMNRFQERAASKRGLFKSLLTFVAPIVSDEDRVAWEKYSLENIGWFREGTVYQEKSDLQPYISDDARDLYPEQRSIHRFDSNFSLEEHPGPGPYVATWQSSPVLKSHGFNFDLMSWGPTANDVSECLETEQIVLGKLNVRPPGKRSSSNPTTAMYATLQSVANRKDTDYDGDPMSTIYFPVFDSFEKDRRLVAMISVLFNWASYFENILPNTIGGLAVVLSNSCDQKWTYEINGSDVHSVGEGDFHEEEFHDMAVSSSFDRVLRVEDGSDQGVFLNQNRCKYKITVYPSRTFRDQHISFVPVLMGMIVAVVFVFTAFIFFMYNQLVEKRQKLVMTNAVQSTAIVSSSFPDTIRGRIMAGRSKMVSPNKRLKSLLNDGNDNNMEEDQPIADLYPNTTVLFADIANFSAWSSSRCPSHVFILLQKLYQAFDRVGAKWKIFKVETIGDCYVAVAGAPHPIEDHAVAMCRFAWDCNQKVRDVMRGLEVRLGPDTGELRMRFGLNSGTVTAGVLRGERSRFQLFGDTVKIASIMESTGKPATVQVSSATAALLQQCGKGHWLSERDDVVQVEGKGILKTFWMVPSPMGLAGSRRGSNSSMGHLSGFDDEEDPHFRSERLADWLVEMLISHMRQIIAKRNAMQQTATPIVVFQRDDGQTNLEEVVISLLLPKFDPSLVAKLEDASQVEIPQSAMYELREYVFRISQSYNRNPFHNFAHACHVSMSANKFLQRIVAPDLDCQGDASHTHQLLHNYTHGIHSDPMTRMAIVFSALMHDAGHLGIPNSQLSKEQPQLDRRYGGRSVAEQNSLDIGWDMLMEDDFSDLRSCLFANQTELHRFRQLLVNVVLATDIFDQELNDRRQMLWDKAFGSASTKKEGGDMETQDTAAAAPAADDNLRATLVMEHLIQAADVSHTMQHWHVYRKWNARLFEEMYQAYVAGGRRRRMEDDATENPASFWYEGELAFFDNFVIPLTKKLKDCNVFGVSSDECLNYALLNRDEWEARGRDLVDDMVADLESKAQQQQQQHDEQQHDLWEEVAEELLGN